MGLKYNRKTSNEISLRRGPKLAKRAENHCKGNTIFFINNNIMDEKLKISIEFSRDQVATVATLAGIELDQIWDKLIKKPAVIGLNDIDDKEAQLGTLIVLVGAAFGKLSN